MVNSCDFNEYNELNNLYNVVVMNVAFAFQKTLTSNDVILSSLQNCNIETIYLANNLK